MSAPPRGSQRTASILKAPPKGRLKAGASTLPEWDSDDCFAHRGFDFAYAIRAFLDPDDQRSLPPGRIDREVLDRATEVDLAMQQRDDDAEAMKDMAQYARRVRRRLGLTQVEFARRIDVPRETIRNWEQGKRCPTGAAKALLRVLDKAPEAALRVLT